MPTECLEQCCVCSQQLKNGGCDYGHADRELTEAQGMKSLSDGWEMGLPGLLMHGTDLLSSCLRQNGKSERTPDLEAVLGMYFLSASSVLAMRTQESVRKVWPRPQGVHRVETRRTGSGVQTIRVRPQTVPLTCFITLGNLLNFSKVQYLSSVK